MMDGPAAVRGDRMAQGVNRDLGGARPEPLPDANRAATGAQTQTAGGYLVDRHGFYGIIYPEA